MHTTADKTSDTKDRPASHDSRNTSEPALQFADNRAETAAQRKLQSGGDQRPQVRQLRAVQAMADQSPSKPAQLKKAPEEELLQSKAAPVQKKANDTGLPDNLKAGVENLSGHSMDDVKVHYNSDKPAKLQAHAYAQGTDIHIASGQEKHLPHEAWHVAQQKQGRVKPTIRMKTGVPVNDDSGLEKEADVMGEKALAVVNEEKGDVAQKVSAFGSMSTLPLQRRVIVNNALDNTYFIEGEDRAGGPYTLLAGSSIEYSVTGLTRGGNPVYHDNQTNRNIDLVKYTLYENILRAYAQDDAIAYEMFNMSEAMTQADARAMVIWLAGQPFAIRRFAYKNRALLNVAKAQEVVSAWHKYPAMFATVEEVVSVLGTALINYNITELGTLMSSNKFRKLADLRKVVGSVKFTDIENLKAIVAHPKLDDAERLATWVDNLNFDTGANLYTVLEHAKIHTAEELSVRLKKYNLTDLIKWLRKPWVARPDGILTAVNGVVPIATANGLGGGATGGQRYTPDRRSVEGGGTQYHLSMSFVPDGTTARYTGFHVTFRRGGSERRMWWSVAAGKVTAGVVSPGITPAMRSEGSALLKSKLVDMNCYM